MTPTLAGFITFIQTVMGISSTYLPTNSPVIAMSLQIATDIVNQSINGVSGDIYTLAVYNLAGDRLLNYAPDVQPPVPYTPPGAPGPVDLPFFAYWRKEFNLPGFVAGVVQSASDNGTGDSLVVPDSLKGLQLLDLQNLKTPYGRQYLALAQQYGPAPWVSV